MKQPIDERAVVTALAHRYHMSEDAVLHLLDALRRGSGSAAQFNHPELGGMGQWMAGGMVMVGDWSNPALKAAIVQLCADLIPLATSAAAMAGSQSPEFGGFDTDRRWWPADLGNPTAGGAQNGVRYAYFAQARRLVVEIAGQVTIYDTLDHQISGVAQQQGTASTLSFQSQLGVVALDRLPRAAS